MRALCYVRDNTTLFSTCNYIQESRYNACGSHYWISSLYKFPRANLLGSPSINIPFKKISNQTKSISCSFPNKTPINPAMELYHPIHPNSLYPFFLPPTYFYSLPPQNHVHWAQTPESHVYTADIPGVRKEDIRVEVEDSRYLVIRTDFGGDDEISNEERSRSFHRKFRLPELVNMDGISAGYEDGVLTVRVPRRLAGRRPRAEDILVDLSAEERNSVAPAA